MTNYGPPGPPLPPRPPASPAQRATYLAYAGAGLGLFGFIWGFLDWVSPSVGGDGSAGYTTSGTGALAATLIAGLVALAEVLEKKPVSLLPAAIAVAGLLITFGVLVSVPDGLDVSAGLILALISSILQVAALIVAWMFTVGRIPAQRPAAQWQPGQPQFPPPQAGPPPGWGPQQYPGPSQPYTGQPQ